MRIIEVPKETGTYADSLTAIGTASLIEEIGGTQTVIKDMGTHFQIECAKDIVPEQFREPSPGFIYIWRRSKEKDRPPGLTISILDYEEEQTRAKAKKQSGAQKKEKELNRALEEQGVGQIDDINPEYRPASMIESMRKGWSSDKDVYHWVTNNPEQALKWLKNELTKDKSKKPPIEVSNSQIFNPASGKGVSAAKTIAKSPGAINKEVIEPFAEWMKYRGAFNALLPYRNGDDFKFFVIEPGDIGPRALSFLRTELLKLNLWGGIKLDIESSLRLAEQLIEHSEVMQEANPFFRIRGRKPSEVIKGLRQAYFKSMGTAAALMNDAFLPLPSWFCIENREDANMYLKIIREHIGERPNQGCIGTLKESHSGDVSILQQYRKWLTTGNIFDLLEFFYRFAVHVMERRGKNEWVKEFTTDNLTILFERGYRMKEIVENPGFLSVAWAIRNSTITALWLQQQKKKKWDVRFGLAQKWKQKIKGGAKEFIPVLAEFVQEYNWEVTSRLEGKYHVVSKGDLDQLIALIQADGKDQSELVGMLLLAYGYARTSQAENPELTNKEDK